MSTATENTVQTETAPETEKAQTTEAQAQPAKKGKRPYVFTPFQARNVLNDMLQKAGLQIELPGPMVYSWAKQGKFKTRISQEDVDRGEEHPRIEADEESFMAFAASFVESKLNGTKVETVKPETSELVEKLQASIDEQNTTADEADELEEDDEPDIDDEDESDEDESDEDESDEDESEDVETLIASTKDVMGKSDEDEDALLEAELNATVEAE
jgi:hypothetical protein